METKRQIVLDELISFCREFVSEPYLAYAEHGVHARFYHRLSLAFEARSMPRTGGYNGLAVDLIQKEYRAAGDLGRSRCASWDICVLASPLRSVGSGIIGTAGYDRLSIDSIVEFGLNATVDHLRDDIERLDHPGCEAEGKFIVHLQRLSDGTSRRDLSPRSVNRVDAEDLPDLLLGTSGLTLFLATSSTIEPLANGLWVIESGQMAASRLL